MNISSTKGVKQRSREANLARAMGRRAFEHGFVVGSDTLRSRDKRHVVNEATHVHWKAGYDAGRAAVAAAANAYEETLP